jgi:dipeptidase E
MNFVFVASEFENIYEKTDWYCNHFLKMFSDCGIIFESVNVVDGRMSKETAQDMVINADVLWLAGGDTPTQFAYLESYGLIPCIKEHKGVIIGMSAGSINMTKTAVCTLTCEHNELKIYEALGLVEFSVEPHFDKDNITKELLILSEKYPLYGICDDSAIVCTEDKILYIGDVFLINKGQVTPVR